MTKLQRMGKLPVLALVAMGFILIMSVAGVATFTVTTTTTTVSFAAETFVADSSTTIEGQNVTKASASMSESGQTQETAVDATSGMATVNSALTLDNWVYQIVVKESSVSSWGSASVYMIELFADGNVVDTLYVSNSTAASGTVEGVTAKFDLGSGDLPDAISYKVQMVAN